MRKVYSITVIRTEERDDYIKALETASVEGNLEGFIRIIAEAVDRSLDTYLYLVK